MGGGFEMVGSPPHISAACISLKYFHAFPISLGCDQTIPMCTPDALAMFQPWIPTELAEELRSLTPERRAACRVDHSVGAGCCCCRPLGWDACPPPMFSNSNPHRNPNPSDGRKEFINFFARVLILVKNITCVNQLHGFHSVPSSTQIIATKYGH